ncbi:MAG: SIMPL domain-containing protein [Candidatus Pacebacteria bacterium]|nr:SIMPL domain-containing protein [Candidatus Paceibacterota bacterium]
MQILENKFFQILSFVLMIVIIVFVAVLINEKTEANNNLISVSGLGEVYVTPDVGLITISVQTENRNVSVATDENSQKMNEVIEYIKSEGVESKDIKTTGYNINPRYEWNNDTGKRTLAGYEVSQSVNVKIRDLSKIGTIISNATSKGANDISSLSFIVDDDEEAKASAKEIAIQNAKEKAKELEKLLGIKMVRVVSFSENSGGYVPLRVAYDEVVSLEKQLSSSIAAPTIETGENKITSTVTITYSIR